MKLLFAKIKAFLGKVPGSIKGIVNGEEIARAVISALTSGSLAGAFLAILPALTTGVPGLVADHLVAGWIVASLTFFGDLIRRKNHGQDVPLPYVGP